MRITKKPEANGDNSKSGGKDIFGADDDDIFGGVWVENSFSLNFLMILLVCISDDEENADKKGLLLQVKITNTQLKSLVR